jgi:hypothetical protein
MIIRTAAATVTGELGEEPFEVLRVLVLPDPEGDLERDSLCVGRVVLACTSP